MKDFGGKLVYVVGGSSGIGLAAARQMASRGAGVVLFARNPGRLGEALAAVTAGASDPTRAFGSFSVDVADGDAVASTMAAAVQRFGPPQVLVNSAGRSRPHRFLDVSRAQFDETMKINLYGVWHTTAALVPFMIEAGRGYIVNVSSLAGFIGVYGFTDYCASKFAVIGFSEALRSELRPHGVDVSVLCPPDTDTPGFHEENRTKPIETRELSANARLMQPDDVAAFLLKAMAKKRFLIVPGIDGRALYLLKHLFPRLSNRIMDIMIRRIQAKQKKKTEVGKMRG